MAASYQTLINRGNSSSTQRNERSVVGATESSQEASAAPARISAETAVHTKEAEKAAKSETVAAGVQTKLAAESVTVATVLANISTAGAAELDAASVTVFDSCRFAVGAHHTCRKCYKKPVHLIVLHEVAGLLAEDQGLLTVLLDRIEFFKLGNY